MKGYEVRETGRILLPGLPIVVRLDGHGFSKFTRGLARPYDHQLSDLMVEVTKTLVKRYNATVGYTQSDEITLLFDPTRGGTVLPSPEALPFRGRVHKMTSLMPGLASSRFAIDAVSLWPKRTRAAPPHFDARIFEVPNRDEAVNAVLWREIDAMKNAVSMAARAHFSHARLNGKSSPEMQEMLFQEHGVNFNDYPARFKRGVYVQRRVFEKEMDAATLARIPESRRPVGPVLRSAMVVLDLPPIRKLVNRVEVLLDGAEPMLNI